MSNGDTAVQVYTKSWVFDGAGEEEDLHDRSLSISSSSPSHSNAQNHTAPNCSNQRRISKVSKLSDATSERFMLQMTSFSRCATPSPVPRSGQTTPVIAHYSDYMDTSSVHGHKSNRLTVDYVSSALSPSAKPKTTTQGPSSISSQPDDGQFASLLAELEQSLMEKKIQSGLSPDNASLTPSTDKYSSKSSSKDLEFSKELEAALQLIQELETPSEGPLGHATMQNQHIVRSDSEKTLSAAASLPSPEACPFSARTSDGPTPTGKQSLNILSIETNSQSTSGYSSPNSYSSNLYSIKESDTGSSGLVEQQHSPTTNSCHNNVVKIYIEPSRNTSYIKTLDPDNLPIADNPISLTSSKSNSVNKSFLLFKKRSKLMPQGDFQNRIFKSECLAYLTEEELMARHQQNRNMIRVRRTEIIIFGLMDASLHYVLTAIFTSFPLYTNRFCSFYAIIFFMDNISILKRFLIFFLQFL